MVDEMALLSNVKIYLNVFIIILNAIYQCLVFYNLCDTHKDVFQSGSVSWNFCSVVCVQMPPPIGRNNESRSNIGKLSQRKTKINNTTVYIILPIQYRHNIYFKQPQFYLILSGIF